MSFNELKILTAIKFINNINRRGNFFIKLKFKYFNS